MTCRTYTHIHVHGHTHTYTMHSLVPRPPPFLPSVCVHNNTREWRPVLIFRWSSNSVYCYERKQKVKMGEAWEQDYTHTTHKNTNTSHTHPSLLTSRKHNTHIHNTHTHNTHKHNPQITHTHAHRWRISRQEHCKALSEFATLMMKFRWRCRVRNMLSRSKRWKSSFYRCVEYSISLYAWAPASPGIPGHCLGYFESCVLISRGTDTKTHGHQHIAYVSTDVRIAYSDKIHFPQLCIKCGIVKSCPGTHTALQAPMIAWLHDGSTYSHTHTHAYACSLVHLLVCQSGNYTNRLIPWRLASQVNRATTVISHTRKYHSHYLNEVITFLLKVHPPIYAAHAVMCI